MRRLLLAAAMAILSLPSFAAPRGLNAADLVALARVTEAQLSPDGRSAVYTLRETDLAADRDPSHQSELQVVGQSTQGKIVQDRR